jgi:hypothetical protein
VNLVRYSLVYLLILSVITSRERCAFVFNNLLKYIVHDGFWVIGISLLCDAEDVAALFNVILDVFVRALVGKLCHFNFLT